MALVIFNNSRAIESKLITDMRLASNTAGEHFVQISAGDIQYAYLIAHNVLPADELRSAVSIANQIQEEKEETINPRRPPSIEFDVPR
jgi:hypothetical protein